MIEKNKHRKKKFLPSWMFCIVCLLIPSVGMASVYKVDVCVYGGTAGGVMAAYSAKKMGKSVLLIEPGKYLGGMTTGGLGSTDVGFKEAITGLSRLFYKRMGEMYNKPEEWSFPPSAATAVINRFVEEAQLNVMYEKRIRKAKLKGGEIKRIVLESSVLPTAPTISVEAKVFIDCSYEGDLMARSGVSYFVGRENNAQYGETLNGVQLAYYHQFPDGVDPYRIEGNPASGLCWGISRESFGKEGDDDKSMQAYNYRLCFTREEGNKRPFEKPEAYNRDYYELLARAMKKKSYTLTEVLLINQVAENKFDVNNRGPLSTNYLGMNHSYPEASYAERMQLAREHREYIKGYLYFLSTDKAVPQSIREALNQYGWAKDEFTDNDNFPHQLYIREARRLHGEYVMTQKNCERKETVADSIAWGSYAMDSHNCRRVVKDGMVKNEGDVQVVLKSPYPIAYRSIVPKREECKNLLVPVCVSSTHIAYGSIRMEPVFMALGQSAGIAAAMSVDAKKCVQDIDVTRLQKILTENPYLIGEVVEKD